MDFEELSLDSPELYVNREIAWLRFNERVLDQSERESTPLLEKLKFLSIFSSNLDEFFMVRLTGLLRLAERQGVNQHGFQGRSLQDDVRVAETLDAVAVKVREDLRRAHTILADRILPGLKKQGIRICNAEQLSSREREGLGEVFREQIFPVLTPMAVDPAHPFPYLSNLSLYLAVQFDESATSGEPLLAFVEVPKQLPRFFAVEQQQPPESRRYIPLEEIIKLNLHLLFPWTRVRGAFRVRVTRNLDYQLLEGEVQDLMRSIEMELKDREQKFVLRLEVESQLPAEIQQRLLQELELDAIDVYEVPEFVGLADFRELLGLDVSSECKDPSFNPRIHPAFEEGKSVFTVLRERDVLLHHPYDSFVSVVDFVDRSTRDPQVLAIKMTLYRGGGDSPIIESLIRAADAGKQVTVVVELKARFDEENNITWSKRLEHAGAHVVFGFVGLKTHAKSLLIVRRENDSLQKYVHLSTGNYNHSTAKLYTDIGFLSSQDCYTNDVANLFNLLTGFNILGSGTTKSQAVRLPELSTIRTAPFDLRDHFLGEIEKETLSHEKHGNGRIVLKMNSLTDRTVIKALYAASQKGVKIALIVRGVCLLRPQVKGVSQRIQVFSIIDRFLEHARVMWFNNNGKPRVYLSSADFMPRNLNRRIEIAWPVKGHDEKERLTEILNIQLADNQNAYVMQQDGTYKPVAHKGASGSPAVRSQSLFIELARKLGMKGAEYDLALSKVKRTKQSKSLKKVRNRRKKSKGRNTEGVDGKDERS